MSNNPMPGWEHFEKRWDAQPVKVIRVSAFLSFCRCPRRYFYQYGCGLDSMGPAVALHFGEAIHAALGWLLGHPQDFNGALKRFELIWTPDLEAHNHDTCNHAAGKRMIFQWLIAQQNSIFEPVPPPSVQTGILPTERQSDFEIPFVVDLGLPILLIGRIDALARHKNTRELWTVEFKTTSDSSNRFYDGFEFNPQMLCYATACRQWGLDVKGCFVQGIGKKKELKTKETEHVVRTQPVLFQQHVLDSHLAFMRYKLGELLHLIEQKNFYQNFTGCNPYSLFSQPGYNCDYSMLCRIPDWTYGRHLFQLKDDSVFQFPKELQTQTPLTVKGESIQ